MTARSLQTSVGTIDPFCYFSNPALQECKRMAKLQRLNVRLAVHMLKLVNDSQETGKRAISPKRKSTRSGARRCPAVGAKRPEMPINAERRSTFQRFFKKILQPSPRLIEVTFSESGLASRGGKHGPGPRPQILQRTGSRPFSFSKLGYSGLGARGRCITHRRKLDPGPRTIHRKKAREDPSGLSVVR